MSTPSERRLRAQIAAQVSWSKTEDRTARTAAGRRSAMERFEREVDPDGVLTPAERARRADHARKAHFARLSLASARSRRRAAEARAAVPVLEAEANAADAELLASGGGAA